MVNTRNTKPNKDNKCYITTSKGGYNKCINISNGWVLPNCVGYAWGRAYEYLGSTPNLSTGNAEDWYNFNDGYKRGSTPKINSIACWSEGATNNSKDGYGHLAYVENIADGKVYVSDSVYNGVEFRYYEFNKNRVNQTFQGFIYLPDKTINTDYTEIVKKVIRGDYGNEPERKTRVEKAGYNYEVVKRLVNEYYKTGVINGTPSEPETDYAEIVKKVIRGDYGNGSERKTRLAQAGYDYETVQKLVNETLMKG